MSKTGGWTIENYEYDELRESVRNRPGMYFGSVDIVGLHNATMDLVYHCVENQKKEIGIVINGSDIAINHEGDELKSSFVTDIVKSACKSFDYSNSQYRFSFDEGIFQSTEPSADALFDTLRELAFLNKHLKIRFNEHDFHYKNGLMDLYQYLKIKAGFYWYDNHHPIGFHAIEGEMELDAVFAAAYCLDPCIFSYANNQKTEEHGSHVRGFFAGLNQAVKSFRQSTEQKKKYKYDGIALIIHVKVQNPQYAGETKRKLDDYEVYGFAKKVTEDNLSRILSENPGIVSFYIK